MRKVVLIVAGAAVLCAAHAGVFGQSWFNAKVLDRLRLSGQKTFRGSWHDVQGDRDTFNRLNYFGQGDQAFNETGDLIISGNDVLDFLTFDVHISSYRYANPDRRRLTLTYDRGPVNIKAGDITTSVGGGIACCSTGALQRARRPNIA